MPILTEDVKLMASQRLSDNEDGGGRMTGVEIVDGNINNLFPDISRLDRVYGRVSLRKAFVSVQTADTDTYSGAHVILSLPAADPNVSVCMFSTGDANDERLAARNRVESYVTVGPRFQGWLWGDQPEGSRALLLFVMRGTKTPDVGSVLCLYKDKGLANEVEQFVRITKVEVVSGEFTSTSDSEYGATAMSFSRDILQLEIGDPLRATFPGVEISRNDSLVTNVFTTVVSDASKYYGVMLPTLPVSQGDIAINVESIFTHLVPSAQGESPLVDLSVGEAGPVIGSGAPYTVVKTAFALTNGAQFHFGRGIAMGSLSLVHNGKTYTDKGDGLLYEGLAQRGTVDYGTGTITFAEVVAATATATATAIIGTAIERVANTIMKAVELANQGYNYTVILEPLPVKKTVVVDYMSQGKWYRLRDNGLGTLVPDVAGTGTGTVNYGTGSVILTCAALPDVDSGIIYAWGSPLEVEDISQDVVIDVAEISHQLATPPVKPGSLLISWLSGGVTVTAADDDFGFLTGAATGSINYATGALLFTPTAIPAADSVYTIDYDRYPFVTGNAAGSGTTFTLPEAPIKPGSLGAEVTVTMDNGTSHVYALRDNGNGAVSAGGWGGNVTDDQVEPGIPGSYVTKNVTASGLAGTIDYTTGIIVLNLAGVSGTEVVTTIVYKRWFTNNIPGTLLEKYSKTTTVLTAASAAGMAVRYSLAAAAQETANETTPALPFVVDLTRGITGKIIIPGSVSFSWGGVRYVDRLGKLYRNPDPATGLGAEVGTIDYITGQLALATYDTGANTIIVHSLLARFGHQFLPSCFFRTPGAPVRPGSFQILGVTDDGRQIAGQSDFAGAITGAMCTGRINYQTGIVEISFGELVPAIGQEGEPWYDLNDIDSNGNIWRPSGAFADQLVYTCVVYSYIPLDADLIGLDPVRLPSDGRVPIVRVGDVVVIHNTQTEQLVSPLAAGQVITLNRANIVHVELYDSAAPLPVRVPTTLYNWDKETQQLTMANPLDLTAYSQPLIAMHRIEDMSLVSGVQISGQIIVGAGLTNAYPVEGTYVSSALLYGDLQARAYGLFDQTTWTSVWSDDLIGSAANASYNEVNYPLIVTNAGGVNGRWALKFLDTTSFQIIEEKLGILGTFYITQDCAPLNPATNQPYFFIDYRGWGTGWAAGNALRFNTDGPIGPLWIARTTLQGPVTEPNDQFTIQIRGDAE